MPKILLIVKAPDPILERKLKTVKNFDDSLAKLVEDMVETLHKSEGLGLGANQVNHDLRLAIVEYTPADEEESSWPAIPLTVLVNPKIIHQSKNTIVIEEGCLSLPNLQRPIERAESIEIINHDISGKRYRLKADGLLARVCQHEIDHLNGILITDHPEAEAQEGKIHRFKI
ncbi:MAG TPA: peptide deformylase [Patescibacteria group bacterium]|nr:peptide deformylase [Patescibacteria group bacterium]